MLTIGEILEYEDIDTYNKLNRMRIKHKKEPFAAIEIKLGDSIENLMGHDSYSRSGGRIKQRKWG